MDLLTRMDGRGLQVEELGGVAEVVVGEKGENRRTQPLRHGGQ